MPRSLTIPPLPLMPYCRHAATVTSAALILRRCYIHAFDYATAAVYADGYAAITLPRAAHAPVRTRHIYTAARARCCCAALLWRKMRDIAASALLRALRYGRQMAGRYDKMACASIKIKMRYAASPAAMPLDDICHAIRAVTLADCLRHARRHDYHAA